MKLNDWIKRCDELIALGQKALLTKQSNQYTSDFLDKTMVVQFRTSGLSFLEKVFGAGSPYCKDFHSLVEGTYAHEVELGLGILAGCRGELAGGWLVTTKGLVSAELFSDFIEMAEHLIAEGYKDPAAVLIGSVLEEHLRQLCQKHSIPVTHTKGDGTIAPLKADSMNSELSKAAVYTKLDQKSVTAHLDLRNKAAHGHYTEYTQEQVKIMLSGVTDFIARTPP
jgi:hypothetical protein